MNRFANWDQARAHLAARGSKLRAAPLSAGGAAWLELVAMIGAAKSASIVTMLCDSANAPVGGYCLVNGELALRQVLPLEGLRPADLDRVVRTMEWRATNARKQLGLVQAV